MRLQIPKENLFPSKLNEILKNQHFNTIISWGQNKNSIEICDLKGFQQKVLPKYFRHKNFGSFVRQMNLYGFKKNRNLGTQIFTNKQLRNETRITELQSKNQKKAEKQILESHQKQLQALQQYNIQSRQTGNPNLISQLNQQNNFISEPQGSNSQSYMTSLLYPISAYQALNSYYWQQQQQQQNFNLWAYSYLN